MFTIVWMGYTIPVIERMIVSNGPQYVMGYSIPTTWYLGCVWNWGICPRNLRSLMVDTGHGLSDCYQLSFNWGISTKYPKMAMLYNVDVMMKHCIWGHPVFRQKPLNNYIGDLQTLCVYPMCFLALLPISKPDTSGHFETIQLWGQSCWTNANGLFKYLKKRYFAM